MILGKVHSIQSLGTLDGPGVRFVVFLQGCPLRCSCCHNPDTRAIDGGTTYSVDELISQVIRFKEYFGKEGGITVSGGEPLLQADFVKELFTLAHENNINTCLDTSGCLLNDNIKDLLTVCDRVLLDIKYTTDSLYKEHVGCSLKAPLDFLSYLNEMGIPTTLRQVIIPTKNDSKENIISLKNIAEANRVVDSVELLPFRKICQAKYDNMGLRFPFESIPEPTASWMTELEFILNDGNKYK